MFVTDTVDAIYPTEPWLPQAIMDRLGEVLARPDRRNPTEEDPALAQWASSKPRPRQPLLTTKRIDAISDLEPFFSNVSLSAYNSVYHSGGRVDWAAVESGLTRELFEGTEPAS